MIPLQFFSQYMRHPRSVGAILPSSRQLAQQMVASIHFDASDCIVEYGPGTGVFTEQLVQKKPSNTKLLIFENNKKFYDLLLRRYGDMDNVYLIYDSAERVAHYLEMHGIEKVDYIVSGLPFASLPKSVTEGILEATKQVLGKDGEFITFQYSKLKQKHLQSFFSQIEVDKVMRNTPPAFVFKCIQ